MLLIEGKPAGWMMEFSSESKDGKTLTSGSKMHMVMKRDALAITIDVASSFTETSDGKPIKAVSDTNMGILGSTKKTFTFKDDGIEVETVQNKQSLKKTIPLPKEAWLTPAAAGRYVEAQLAKGEKVVKFITMDPSNDPTPFSTEVTITGKEDIEVLGKTVPSLVAETRTSILPSIVMKSYVNDEGHMLKMSMTPIPGFEMTVILADKDLAQAQVDPPEVLANTLIAVKTPIKDARHLISAVYEIKFKPHEGQAKDKVKPELPKAGFQKVVWGDEDTAKVIMDLTQFHAPGDDLPTKENREASSTLNSDDPEIKKLVEKALKGAPADMTSKDKAKKLREFVYSYIHKKDLSVGFAGASEVARTRQGDCTEHAVLLAAMLRAAGIPSRTVSGLVYADAFAGQRNIWGYHMWAQAWVDVDKDNKPSGGTWIDVDATLPDWPFDAAHITLAVSSLSDTSSSNDMVKLIPIIGRIEIKVIETKAAE